MAGVRGRGKIILKKNNNTAARRLDGTFAWQKRTASNHTCIYTCIFEDDVGNTTRRTATPEPDGRVVRNPHDRDPLPPPAHHRPDRPKVRIKQLVLMWCKTGFTGVTFFRCDLYCSSVRVVLCFPRFNWFTTNQSVKTGRLYGARKKKRRCCCCVVRFSVLINRSVPVVTDYGKIFAGEGGRKETSENIRSVCFSE